MKAANIIIFISIILSIHFFVNFYIYQRGMQWLNAYPTLKSTFRITMLVLFLSYPAGRFLEKIWYAPPSTTLHWIGAFWFAGMLYFTLSLITVDLVRIANYFFHFLPTKGSEAYLKLKLITGTVITSGVLLTMFIGFLNAWHPKISRHTINIDKQANSLKSLKIVAASDIHLGTIIGPRKTNKLVETINSLQPDLILFAGDVVDEDVQPVIKQNLGENLKQLNAPLGVYASTGNHEYIGGVERAVEYLTEHGIKVLRDTSIIINNSFVIAAREDRDKNRTQHKRKEIKELLQNIDQSLPIILLDHQPYNLQDATDAGIDLQISGHTHHGQLWPFGYITEKIFEVSRGYKQKDSSHFIVSTGFGTWGPPIRTGNRPEILEITIHFAPKIDE
ncbi:metallophosphoesterase [Carboxylicivirga linearis]|uniref:Metallophosphoesterase n=1 Tax=Carboxylicivirga linearis TaxID=1628157 RepID=A0ABS5JZD3_9BACT|nr:metallophosphoesterase [Carboxylicivirga linearis]MBS2100272.1 metallophosphoesterase [Carboxylicivirga linearis]